MSSKTTLKVTTTTFILQTAGKTSSSVCFYAFRAQTIPFQIVIPSLICYELFSVCLSIFSSPFFLSLASFWKPFFYIFILFWLYSSPLSSFDTLFFAFSVCILTAFNSSSHHPLTLCSSTLLFWSIYRCSLSHFRKSAIIIIVNQLPPV